MKETPRVGRIIWGNIQCSFFSPIFWNTTKSCRIVYSMQRHLGAELPQPVLTGLTRQKTERQHPGKRKRKRKQETGSSDLISIRMQKGTSSAEKRGDKHSNPVSQPKRYSCFCAGPQFFRQERHYISLQRWRWMIPSLLIIPSSFSSFWLPCTLTFNTSPLLSFSCPSCLDHPPTFYEFSSAPLASPLTGTLLSLCSGISVHEWWGCVAGRVVERPQMKLEVSDRCWRSMLLSVWHVLQHCFPLFLLVLTCRFTKLNFPSGLSTCVFPLSTVSWSFPPLQLEVVMLGVG